MSHNHIHTAGEHNHLTEHTGDVKNVKLAFFLNFGFSLIEFVGGFFTNSMAILSDAVHDLGDSLSLGLAWYFQKYSSKRRDKIYTYGYKRFSLIGALVNSIVLIVGSILILSESVPRLFHPKPANAEGMFLLAILGIIVNGIAYFRMHSDKNLNERVVSLHLLEDVLGWIAVLIGSAIMHFTYAPIIDPILSILIAIFVLSNVYRNLRDLFRIILQGTPEEIKTDDLVKSLEGVTSIDSVHDLHLWSVDGTYNVLTVHVVVTSELSMEQLSEVKDSIRNILNKQGIEHITIEFETLDEHCGMENCCE